MENKNNKLNKHLIYCNVHLCSLVVIKATDSQGGGGALRSQDFFWVGKFSIYFFVWFDLSRNLIRVFFFVWGGGGGVF